MAERFFYSLENAESVVTIIVDLAKKGRSDGLLALIDDVDEMSESEDSYAANNMLVYGLRQVTRGTDPDILRLLLERQRGRLARTVDSGWKVWKPLMTMIARVDCTMDIISRYAAIQCDERFESHGKRREALMDFIGTSKAVWDPSRREKLFHSLPLSFTEHPLARVNLQTALQLNTLPEMEDILESQYHRYSDSVSNLCSIVTEGVCGVQSGTNPDLLYDSLMTFTENTSAAKER